MKRLIAILIILFAAANIVPAAAKPKPPDPYPQPEPEAQGDAYPPPGEGLPGITVFEPDPDDPDPRPGVPYVWGIFMDTDGAFKIFVTIDRLDFELEGIACIISFSPDVVHCYDLYPHHYADGKTMYHSGDIGYCGTWAVQYAILGGVVADIRQPNTYLIRCLNPV